MASTTASYDLARFDVELFHHPEGVHTVVVLRCRFCDFAFGITRPSPYVEALGKCIMENHPGFCPPKHLNNPFSEFSV